MCDDVFDEDADDRQLQERDFDKYTRDIEDLHFRDAFLQAKDATLQQGFDDGLRESFTNVQAVSRLQGLIMGVVMGSIDETSEERRQELERIMAQLEWIRECLSDYDLIHDSDTSRVIDSFESVKEKLKVLLSDDKSVIDFLSQCPRLSFENYVKLKNFSKE